MQVTHSTKLKEQRDKKLIILQASFKIGTYLYVRKIIPFGTSQSCPQNMSPTEQFTCLLG